MMDMASITMEEQAKEELEMLESQYPNSFHYLKLELKSFIFPQNTLLHSSIFADTQESSSAKQRRRKRKSSDIMEGGCSSSKKKGERDRVDIVLERAEACLQKIRHLKTSLLSNT